MKNNSRNITNPEVNFTHPKVTSYKWKQTIKPSNFNGWNLRIMVSKAGISLKPGVDFQVNRVKRISSFSSPLWPPFPWKPFSRLFPASIDWWLARRKRPSCKSLSLPQLFFVCEKPLKINMEPSLNLKIPPKLKRKIIFQIPTPPVLGVRCEFSRVKQLDGLGFVFFCAM